MKKILSFITAAVIALSVLSGCTSENARQQDERVWAENVTYTNLNDKESQKLLEELMAKAGISDLKQQVLFKHIDQINGILNNAELTKGFETRGISDSKYDPYELQDRWTNKYPEFLGYNCRITAYTLFSDFININKDAEIRDSYILMDLDSLSVDDSAVPEGTDKFRIMFSSVPTDNTKDINVHLKNWNKALEDRGAKFAENNTASLISVVLHDQIDSDELFIGHTGVLFEAEDGTLYFLEKLAFQEPYQLCAFETRAQRSDYLMKKYDTDYNQSTVAPIVLENEHLIEGYRIVPEELKIS